MTTNYQKFNKILIKNKVSITQPRKLIFEILLSNEHTPQTMRELVEKTEHQIDRASVYRTVELLEKIGVIKRIYLGWKYKLELGDEFHNHHHHITCTKCGAVHVTHNAERLEKVLIDMAERCGYKITDHFVEMQGVCSRCSALKL